MKIAILTLPLDVNFGGILQAYALQKVLTDMGHDVVVLDKNRDLQHYPFRTVVKRFVSRILRLVFKRQKIQYLNINTQARHEYEAFFHITQNTQSFINAHIKRYTYRNINRDLDLSDYDAIIVGSDQVFRPACYGGDISHMFLDFVSDLSVKRISYAASFGIDYWEFTPEETIVCKRLLSKFDAVSVRESSGIQLCKKYFERDASLVLDPTLLLSKEDYLRLFDEKDANCPHNGLMAYILDESPDEEEIVGRISASFNLEPFQTNAGSGEAQHSVESWLASFDNCSVVVTDSFHACVFSIIFHKPFFVIENSGRGNARIESLLSIFHLENRVVHLGDDALPSSVIDWTAVDQIWSEWVNASKSFLISNLSR